LTFGRSDAQDWASERPNVKIKNGEFDQYGAEPFEQQQFGIAGVEGVNIAIAVGFPYFSLFRAMQTV